MTSVDPFAWWRAALAGENPPIHSEPECGYFLMKRGKGEFVPASIYWDGPRDEDGNICGDEALCCEVGGDQCEPLEMWLWLAKRPISLEEYGTYLTKMFTGEAV